MTKLDNLLQVTDEFPMEFAGGFTRGQLQHALYLTRHATEVPVVRQRRASDIVDIEGVVQIDYEVITVMPTDDVIDDYLKTVPCTYNDGFARLRDIRQNSLLAPQFTCLEKLRTTARATYEANKGYQPVHHTPLKLNPRPNKSLFVSSKTL